MMDLRPWLEQLNEKEKSFLSHLLIKCVNLLDRQ